MKLLHTSDWHLGMSDGNRSLLEDQVFFIDALCKIIQDENVDAVLLAGDVFDRAISSEKALELYDGAMTKICLSLNRPVLVIAGNHDGSRRLSNCSRLLEKAGLHVAGVLTREPDAVRFEDTEVFLLPWFTEVKARSLFPEKQDEIRNLTDAYQVVTDHIREQFTEGKRHILLAHAFTTDAETSTSDRTAEIGFASQIPASVFEGFDYVALGHIHKPQDVNSFARYSGTPMPYSFGKEEKQEKSVTIIDAADMTRKIVPVPVLHKRTTLTGTMEELMNPDQAEDVLNGYVRLQITDSYVGLSAMAQLRELYPNFLEVAGKSFEGDGSSISLTMEEFEKLETNPMEIFRYFCEEVTGEPPSEHHAELFRKAIEKAEEENS